MIQTYLKFDPPIKGGSRNEKHKDEMEILSWQGGLTQSMSGARSSDGGTVGQADHQPIYVTKMADGALPELMKRMQGGDPIKGAVLSCYRANGSKEPHLYLKVEMEDVRLARLDVSGGGEGLPVESFALDYGAASYIYTALNPDGTPAGNTAVKVDLRKGTVA
jgi:type VI secretion system secreted protein Hcp